MRDIFCFSSTDYVHRGRVVGCFGPAGHMEGGHGTGGGVCSCEVRRERGVGVAGGDSGEVVRVGSEIVLRMGLVVEGKAVGGGCCGGGWVAC